MPNKRTSHLYYVVLAFLVMSLCMIPSIGTAEEMPESNASTSINAELPSFMPSITDKMRYEWFNEPYKPTPPLADSELAEIVFQESWLLNNDKDEADEAIMVTFPASWLDKTPEIAQGDTPIKLSIPKTLLKLEDMNNDPTAITVHLPSRWFEGYPIIEPTHTDVISEEPDEMVVEGGVKGAIDGSRAIEYSERMWYLENVANNVTGAKGYVKPDSYSNPLNESFLTYQEREIYTDSAGDIVEIISEFSQPGGTYVWVAVYDNGQWMHDPNWLKISVTPGQQIDYVLWVIAGGYSIHLRHPSGYWYSKAYDDQNGTEPNGITWLVGSTELDTRGGIASYFYARTNPLTTEYVYYDADWRRTQLGFQYNSGPVNQPYVRTTGSFDANGALRTVHVAGSSI